MTDTTHAKFTPGPWVVSALSSPRGNVTFDVGPGDESVIDSDGFIPSEADARLIAAAPALYDALKQIAEHAESDHGYQLSQSTPMSFEDDWGWVFEVAREVLAKVERTSED